MGRGVAGSQPMSIQLCKWSPNKLWRFNSICNGQNRMYVKLKRWETSIRTRHIGTMSNTLKWSIYLYWVWVHTAIIDIKTSLLLGSMDGMWPKLVLTTHEREWKNSVVYIRYTERCLFTPKNLFFLENNTVHWYKNERAVPGWGPDVSDQTIPGPEYNSLLWPI